MRALFRIFVLGILGVIVVALFYPFQQTVAPDWQVSVVDDKGVRLSGIHIRETWQQFSVESKAHEEVLSTDANGAVHFPKRVINVNYLRRAYGCWRQRHSMSPPVVCGPQASVWAFGPGLGTLHEEDTKDSKALIVSSELWPDKVAEQQISMFLLHHCPTGRIGTGCKLSDVYAPGAPLH